MKLPIYLDHNATTPLDPQVLEAMMPYFTTHFGNPASIDHHHGTIALKAVEKARQQIADLIGARDSEEIIFTSGATEADNLAILGTAERLESKGKHIITCVTEHKAVLDTCAYLKKKGFDVTYLRVDHLGHIAIPELKAAIRQDTILISLMAANNETGVLHPMKEIGRIAKENGILFHSDATQAVGHIPVNIHDWQVDMLSLSGHKFYGPKGVGALYIRKRQPRVRVLAQQHGGGQERGMRSGSLNVPAIVGLGEAAYIAQSKNSLHLAKLRDALWHDLLSNIPNIERNGDPKNSLPHTLNIWFKGLSSKAMLIGLKDIISISTGSACTTMTNEPSHVLNAMTDRTRGLQSIRIGLGRNSKIEEIKYAAENIAKITKKLYNSGIERSCALAF